MSGTSSTGARTARTATSSGTPGSHDRSAVPLAILLWVAVVLALAYGVASTASKVVALFG